MSPPPPPSQDTPSAHPPWLDDEQSAAAAAAAAAAVRRRCVEVETFLPPSSIEPQHSPPSVVSSSNTTPASSSTNPAHNGGGPNSKKSSSRRNAWGNLSYADLITQAIESAPDKRLTLAQVYEWMVQNITYFKDKGDSNSSAGWKVRRRPLLATFLLIHPELALPLGLISLLVTLIVIDIRQSH